MLYSFAPLEAKETFKEKINAKLLILKLKLAVRLVRGLPEQQGVQV